MVVEFGNYQLDDEPTRVDRDAVWSFLSSQAYWARWRTRQDVERQLDSAWRVVGVYDVASDGRMVGFARAISDGVAFAYLADTYIVDADRGQGLGKELVRVMIDCGPGVSSDGPCIRPMPTASMHNSGSFDLMTRTLSESLATAPSAEKVTIQWPRLRSTGPPSGMTTRARAPLVLIHGHPFDRSMWAPQVTEFTGSGRRVIAPDLRGYGESSVTPGTVDWSTFARDTAAVLDHLQLDDVVLGGLSMGGQIVMEYYRLFPDRVRALVLADTFCHAETEDGRKARHAQADRLLRAGMRGYAEEGVSRGRPRR